MTVRHIVNQTHQTQAYNVQEFYHQLYNASGNWPSIHLGSEFGIAENATFNPLMDPDFYLDEMNE